MYHFTLCTHFSVSCWSFSIDLVDLKFFLDSFNSVPFLFFIVGGSNLILRMSFLFLLYFNILFIILFHVLNNKLLHIDLDHLFKWNFSYMHESIWGLLMVLLAVQLFLGRTIEFTYYSFFMYIFTSGKTIPMPRFFFSKFFLMSLFIFTTWDKLLNRPNPF